MHKSFSLTIPPLDVLTRIEFFLIRFNSVWEIKFLVSLFNGKWIVIKSAIAKPWFFSIGIH